MVTNVQDFKKTLVNGGARANLFKVTLNLPNGGGEVKGVSEFLVKTAELPGSTITPIIIPFRGRQLKVAGDKTFDPWTITVMNDRNFTIRNAMEYWMSEINNHEDNQGVNDGYFAEMLVSQLDRNGKEIETYRLVDAWPSDLGPIGVSFDAENQIEEYQITFQYQYWLRGNTQGQGLATS